jgi:hypothetical protein
VNVLGRPSTEYVSDETTMWSYLNLHLVFEQMRARARRAARGSPLPDDEEDGRTPNEPPRVLIIGQESSGKTSASKILTNYAVRAGTGWSPVLVNIDPSEVFICKLSLRFGRLNAFRAAGLSQGLFLHVLSQCLFRHRHLRTR